MSVLSIDDVQIDLAAFAVRRGGEDYHLRQQTARVFEYLIAHRDRVVPKDELVSAVWKDVAVSDSALAQCVKEIRQALGDDSREPRFIRTVPRVGYQFIPTADEPAGQITTTAEIEEIRSIELQVEEDDLPAPRARRFPLVLGTAAVTLLAVAGAYGAWRAGARTETSPGLVLADRPGQANVVLTFLENQSGKPELDWLREGLADMLITDLARSPAVGVLGRQQVALLMQHRGHAPATALPLDAALELARTAHAGTLVVGSYKAAGGGLRVDVQTYDVASGRMGFAERANVDRLDRLFKEIDSLAAVLTRRLGAAPLEETSQRGLGEVMTNSLEAYRDYSEGVEKVESYHRAEGIALLERALALDPDFVMAEARIGYAYVLEGAAQAERAKPYLQRAFQRADRLTERDRLSIGAWFALANLDYTGAIDAYRKLLARDPADSEAYRRLGLLLNAEERLDESLQILLRGLRVDPYFKQLYNALGGLYVDLNRPDEAIATVRRFVELAPDDANAYDSLALALQFAGRADEALAAYDKALAIDPKFLLVLVHRANLRFQQGQSALAIADFTRFAEWSDVPNDRARGHLGAAWVWFQQHNRDQAMREFALARQEVPIDRNPPWELMVFEDEYQLAPRVPGVVKQSPGRSSRGFMRVDAYREGLMAARVGQTERALAAFREALGHRPVPWLIESLDDCVAKYDARLGRWTEAVQEYRRVIDAHPSFARAHFDLAQAYERTGDRASAITEYRRFLELWPHADPDLPQVQQAKQRTFTAPSPSATPSTR